MTEHTPTPWAISPVRTTEDTAMIVGGEGFEFGLIADVTEDYDAAFIVKAVNSHEALVAALKGMVDMYADLVNSGDAGFWDPEKVDEVKHARAALQGCGHPVGTPSTPQTKES